MDTDITATELGRNLSTVLNRVHYRGERFRVARNGETVAVLGPATPGGITLRELASQIGDLPLPGDDFADDLAAIRRGLPSEEPPAWPC